MSYVAAVLSDGPRAFWLLNEASGTDALDSSVGANPTISTGSYVSSPTLGGAGLIGTGSAVETVSSSYVTVPVPVSDIGTTFSLELWFEYVSGTAPVFRDNRTSGGWYLDLSGTNPVVGTGTNIDDTPASHTITTVTSASLKSGRQHFALTGDGSMFRAYVAGALVDSWAGGLNQSFAYTLMLGKDGANTGHVRAKYAALAFYRKTLGASRIAAHYAAADLFAARAAATVTAHATPLVTPGNAHVGVAALPTLLTAPVATRSTLVLASSTTDATTDPLDAPTLLVAPVHIVSPAVPAPTLVDGRPQ